MKINATINEKIPQTIYPHPFLFIILFIELFFLQEGQKMAIINFDFFSPNVWKTVHTTVILPCGEADGNVEPPYRTLYWLPGFSSSASDILSMTSIRLNATRNGIAVVIVDGDNSFYVDRATWLNYGKMVAEDLVSATRQAFRLSDKKEDTFIGGNSMGGYGAFYNGLRYTDTFSKIVTLHPGFEAYAVTLPGTDILAFPQDLLDRMFGSRENYYDLYHYTALLENADKSRMPEIFHSCGDADPLVGEINSRFKAYWEEKQLPFRFMEAPGGHDEVFLNNILPHVFAFLKK